MGGWNGNEIIILSSIMDEGKYVSTSGTSDEAYTLVELLKVFDNTLILNSILTPKHCKI